MCKWQVAASTLVQADIGSVWKIWSDVSAWNTWDSEVESSSLDGKFATGTTGKVKPKGWKELPFTITLATKNARFITQSKMAFTTLTFDHTVTELPDGQLLITHIAKASGLLAGLLFFTLRPQLKRCLPTSVAKIAKKAK